MPQCNELTFSQMAIRIGKILGWASYGVPGLPYFNKQAKPSEVFQWDTELAAAMRTRPTNTVGAGFRVAYWLAVGSLEKSGTEQISLLKNAYGYFIASCNAAAMDATYYLPVGFITRTMANHTGVIVRSAKKADIEKILARGIVSAQTNNSFVATNNLTILISLPDCEDKDNIDLGLPTGRIGIGAIVAIGVGLLIAAIGIGAAKK